MEEIFRKGDVSEKYRIRIEDDAVTTGATAYVWRVRHLDWDTDLAMKMPRREIYESSRRKKDFIRECNLWIDLGLHPNIAPCYYVREIEGVPAVFSEWCDKGSLHDMIYSGELYKGTLEEQRQRIAKIALQILKGLEYAQSKGVIHKDIKPQNILVNSRGEVKITDFGLSDASYAGYTERYCSPAQKTGCTPDHTTDMYSWAVTVMEMYAGECSWDTGEQAWEYFDDIMDSARVPAPKDIRNLIMRPLDPDDDKGVKHPFVMRAFFGFTSGMESTKELAEKNKSLADTAGTLNNKALSYICLGEPQKAEECWERVLKVYSAHPETVYNYGVYRWERGRLTDNGLLELLRVCGKDAEQYAENVRRAGECKLLRTFDYAKRHDTVFASLIDGVWFSPDGKRLAALTDPGRYIIWDVGTGEKISEQENLDTEKWYTSGESRLYRLEHYSNFGVRIVEKRTGRVLHTFRDEEVMPEYSFSPDGKFFAAGLCSDVIRLRLWRVPEDTRCVPALSRVCPVSEYADMERRRIQLWDDAFDAFFNNDEKRLFDITKEMEKASSTPFGVYFKQQLYRWDSSQYVRYDPHPVRTDMYDAADGVFFAAPSPKGRYVAVVSRAIDREAGILDSEKRKFIDTVAPPACEGYKYGGTEDKYICAAWFDEKERYIKFAVRDHNAFVPIDAYDNWEYTGEEECACYDLEERKFIDSEEGIKWAAEMPDITPYRELSAGRCAAVSADGNLLVCWESDEPGGLTVYELDYRLEYEPENDEKEC